MLWPFVATCCIACVWSFLCLAATANDTLVGTDDALPRDVIYRVCWELQRLIDAYFIAAQLLARVAAAMTTVLQRGAHGMPARVKRWHGSWLQWMGLRVERNTLPHGVLPDHEA